jgi:hypothetical protein
VSADLIPRERLWQFVGPSIRDARLHTACVLITIQVLGQTVLDFELSIAQILVSLATCAVLEVLITARRTHTIAWPASALLTGNGVALILRVPGTEHGDWWSLRGWWIYAATAGLGLISKYVIRVDGRPLFNPSNIALVGCFLLLGSDRVEPLDFWWGPADVDVLLAIAVIVIGGVVILSRLRLLAIAVWFWVVFAVSLAVVAWAGHCMTARWHVGALCGREFWWVLVTSPEVLIFLGFMITDPRTIPQGARARIAFASAIGAIGALLIAPQRTEFGAKVGLLSALAIACAARPLLERAFAQSSADGHCTRRGVVAITIIGATAGGLVLAGAPARGDELPEASADVSFPPVAPADVPSFSIADDRLSRQVHSGDAREISIDLVADLALQERALCARDLQLAAASADRAWLDHLEREMQRAAEAREVDVPVYDLDTLVVSVALRRGQAAPAVLATVTGTRRFEHYGHDCDQPTSVSEPEAVVMTFEVLWNGQRYLIVSDQLPEDWTPPTAA